AVRLPQRLFAAVEVPVSAVQVPVRRLDAQEHQAHVKLELRARFVETQPGQQDAFGPPPVGELEQRAARMRREQLVDLGAEPLEQRLLEAELQVGGIGRVDQLVQIGQSVLV